MNDLTNKNPIIYLIAASARSGKDTFAGNLKYLHVNDGKKVAIIQISKYIKDYAKVISGWDGNDENKPRTFLQELGTDLIRVKLGLPNLFINRIIEDIKIYSYFFDIIIVSDIRFKEEIDSIKEEYSNVKVIHLVRLNYESELTKKEQDHISEKGLDGYSNYDYDFECKNLDEVLEKAKTVYEESGV